jgi:hypothetical protein
MKKVLIPVGVVAVIAVIIIIIVASGSGLSGRYNLVSGGFIPPFHFTNYLIFDGDTVTYNYASLDMTNTYTIKDNRLILDYGYYGATFSYDFKKEGNKIYIDDSVWQKE